jgi:undecaprenyl-diphosphatase
VTAGAARERSRTLLLWGDPAPWAEVRSALVRLLVICLSMTAVVIGLGFLVTRWSGLSSVESWDLSFERTLAANRTGWGNDFTAVGTELAETVPVLLLTIFGVDLVASTTRRWRAAGFVAMAVAGEKLVYMISVLAVGRERPPVPTVGHTYATNSFPSGHVGSAVVLYGALALVLWWARPDRRVGRVVAVGLVPVLASVVAFGRMYRGFHYPSDVVVGALMGAVWLTACAWVLRPRAVLAPSP